jgi:hypothetical protein
MVAAALIKEGGKMEVSGTPIYMDNSRFVRDLSDLGYLWDHARRTLIGTVRGKRLYAVIYTDRNRRPVLRIGNRIWGDPNIYPAMDAVEMRFLANNAGLEVHQPRLSR